MTSKSSGELRILLFGPGSVLVRGEDLTGRISKRAMWLLAALALREGKPIERQRLAGIIWPESSDESALHNLRQTLTRLRSVLGSAGSNIESVSPRSLALRLDGAVTVDALEFDQSCRNGSPQALEAALGLYIGPLLSECDEPFAREAREFRSREYLEASDRLAAHYLSEKNFHDAIRVLRRASSSDPYREKTCRDLMSALSASGEVPSAMEVYRAFRRLLREDLNSEPDAETRAHYFSIRKGSTPSHSAGPLRPRHLPAPFTTLVGRKREIEELVSLSTRCRLITLTGFGGVGKTRLAIAAGEKLQQSFFDGVWFVDFAPIQAGAAVPYAIAAALEIHEEPERPILATIAETLQSREILVVLDNCEHLVGAVANCVERLLTASHGLHVLATSRQPLEVSGEYVWIVPTMSLPQPERTAESITESDAVQLFLERCALPTKVRTVPELEKIASICRRLDGVPLALELAAARTNVLSLAEIDDRLHDRFALLSGLNRGMPRDQTLRAAMEWSWKMLSEPERSLLAQVSVFPSDFSVEAVESIALGLGGAVVLNTLSALVDRSLVVPSSSRFGNRFRMLETVREFATDKVSAEYLAQCRDRHRDHFLSWIERADKESEEMDRGSVFARIEAEHDNLRAAIAWSHAREQPEEALRMAVCMGSFWDTRGHITEGRQQLEAALSKPTPGLPAKLRGRAHVHAGWIAVLQQDGHAACRHFEEALSLSGLNGSEDAFALNCLGGARLCLNDTTGALDAFSGALAIFRSIENTRGAATALSNMAEVCLQCGDYSRARALLEESQEEMAKIPDTQSQTRGLVRCNLALTDFFDGRLKEAGEGAAAVVRYFYEAGSMVSLPLALELVGLVAAEEKRWERAATLLGASETLAKKHGAPLSSITAKARDHAKVVSVKGLGRPRFDSAFNKGQALGLDEAVAFAVS